MIQQQYGRFQSIKTKKTFESYEHCVEKQTSGVRGCTYGTNRQRGEEEGSREKMKKKCATRSTYMISSRVLFGRSLDSTGTKLLAVGRSTIIEASHLGKHF